jgi:hypothetical protein
MKKRQSLVERAKAIDNKSGYGRRNGVSKEDEELAAAWVNNEVTLNQVQMVKGLSSATACYSFLALSLKHLLNPKL